jgi:hypothetical protein
MQLIATQSKQFIFNYYSVHYNYTHDAILTSLIVIHLLKYDMLHYEKIWTLKKKSKYWSPLSIMIVNDDPRLQHVAQ